MADEVQYNAAASSDALKDPVRVVFLTPKTSAAVKVETEKRLMSYPHLLLREMLVFEILTILLVMLALFWDAPLEQLANPLLTPNPAKAPWYFLGLQELLHYFPPIVAGIIIPTLVVVALIVIPYFDVNIKGERLWDAAHRLRLKVFVGSLTLLALVLAFYSAWTVAIPTALILLLNLAIGFRSRPGLNAVEYLRMRPLSWWIMTWFVAVSTTLTVVGTFFRGPGWSWIWPWK
jgi:quinol-cytochrome oxidoreductase complex cytochrome b subunit